MIKEQCVFAFFLIPQGTKSEFILPAGDKMLPGYGRIIPPTQRVFLNTEAWAVCGFARHCVLQPVWHNHVYCRSWAAGSGNRHYIPYRTSLCEENNPNYNHISKCHHCTLFALKQEGPMTPGNTVLCCFIREPYSQPLEDHLETFPN